MSRFTTTAPTRASSAPRARCRQGSEQGAVAPSLGWTSLISRSEVGEGTTAITSAPTRASSAHSLLLSAALVGCASYSPSSLPPGTTEAAVVARMGAPTARYPLPDGRQRLEYARGPYGKHTYMLTLDTSGRLQQIEQVLTEQRFSTIAPGQPMNEVRSQLGRPSETRVGWRGVGEVWSYRYDATFCQWFQVWGVGGVVREAAYAPDPLCDVDHDDRLDH